MDSPRPTALMTLSHWLLDSSAPSHPHLLASFLLLPTACYEQRAAPTRVVLIGPAWHGKGLGVLCLGQRGQARGPNPHGQVVERVVRGVLFTGHARLGLAARLAIYIHLY